MRITLRPAHDPDAARPAYDGAPTAPLTLGARGRQAALPALLGLAVFVVSLTLRLWGLDLVLTTDEGYWMQRSVRFATALARGDWDGTFRAGHPGVTVMWTATLGIGAERLAPLYPERFARYETLQRTPSYLSVLSDARRGVALVTSLLVTVAVLLSWRLFGGGAALLGGILLALDPYAIGMTRLLHVDALLAPLMLVSLLAGLVFFTAARGWPYLVLSAVCGGLALLTKAPAGILPLFLGLLGLWAAVGAWRGGLPAAGAAISGLWPVLAWGAAAALVYLLLFPALWVDLPGRAWQLVTFVQEVGLQPHNGNFFLGQPVLDDPGLFYYFVAMPLRMSPLVALGLALLAIQARPGENRRAIHWLLLFAALFMVMMSVASKKFDRYLLPVLLLIDMVAGVGLWRAASLAWSRLTDRRTGRPPSFLRVGVALAGVAALVALVQLGLLARVWPYPIAYYNPLAGGPERARDLIMMGWGEGLEQVGAYLNSLPGAERLVVVTSYNHVVRPRFAGETLPIAPYMRGVENLPAPDYLVLYVNAVQRRQISPEVAYAQAVGEPVFVARVNGLEYAWVYHLPRRGPRPAVTAPIPVDEPNEGDEN